MENKISQCPTSGEYCNLYCPEFNAPCDTVYRAFYSGGVIFVSNYLSLNTFENILEQPELVKPFEEHQSKKWKFFVFLRVETSRTVWNSIDFDLVIKNSHEAKLQYYKLYKFAMENQALSQKVSDYLREMGIFVESVSTNAETKKDSAQAIDDLHISLVNRLKSMPYNEYLKTRHWKKLRQQKLQESGNKCQMCGSKAQLELHHNSYENRGEEKLEDLIILCKNCHSKHHTK